MSGRRVDRTHLAPWVVLLAGLSALRVFAGGGAWAQTPSPQKPSGVDFNRDIRPILSDNCFTCHGPNEADRMANLRLDLKEGGAFDPREGYQIITPGSSAQSRLYQKISAKDEADRMPPSFSGRVLTPKQIELIREWIDQGAHWETHWAFVAPRRPPAPAIMNQKWPRNEIDRFVLARLEREGLKPAHQADRATLIRRVTLDLTGLPPTPGEVKAFLADPSPDAYEKVVDRLLSSPHYGERMAMQWLDLARYADTHGYHIDSQRDMWRWRDWVIDAFNRNLPFDQFTLEQLAGDLLPNATLEQRIATAFNRNHMINFEGGAIPEEYHNEYVVDRLDTTATVWMATTLGCARCHDHKYDPFKQRDFYRFAAFFNSVPEKGLDGQQGNAVPVLQLPSANQQRELDELKQKIAAASEAMPEKEIAALQAEWQKTALATIPGDTRDGLAAHFEFENDLKDTSGHHLPAEVLRGGVTYGYGVVGKAAEFSGEADVELGAADSFDPAHPFTLAFWFSPGSKFEMAVLQKLDDPRTRRGFEVLLDNTEWVGWQKRASHIIVRLIHDWPEDAIEIRTKERVRFRMPHLSLTYDGSGKAAGLHLFLDGKPQEMEILKDHLTGPVTSGRPLEVGNKDLGKAFKGRLDDLRIYDRILAPSEIEQLAVHQPARALVAGLSGACEEMGHLKDSDVLVESDDPLVEQSKVDTPAYGIKEQCEAEKEKIRDYFLTWVAPENFRKLHADRKSLKEQKAELDQAIPNLMVMEDMSKPRETHILARGDYRSQGETVTPGVPSVLPPLPAGAPPNRLGLAKWLIDPSNPLTARVAVNRYWQLCFGTGIVKTSEDFGSQGEPPSHPELLDWLATEFVRTGWDVKAMMRLIVTSATYRQSSRVTPQLVERDPENRLLARGPRFRLPAEIVRDNALSVSGLLNPALGGPSVYPYQPAGLWEEMAFGEGFTAQTYTPSHGADLYRRSLYTFWKRTVPPPSLATFDAPDREKCTARRAVTNTPLQALVLMNDPTYVEAARALAQRTLKEAGRGAAQRINYAFSLAEARRPAPQELNVLRQLAWRELAHYRRDRDAADKLLSVGESVYDKKLDPSELAAWTTVASAILNLDETVTKE
jgi:mono/diheme cytochrome c family protein